MATIAFVTEEGAAHQAPYREAINSIAGIDRALLMDPGGTTLEESRRACGAKVQAAETSVEALLRHGAPDLAIVSMIGAHAPAVIEPLLEAEADPLATDASGKTPWDLAQDNDVLKESDAYWRLNDARFNSRRR